MLSFSIRRKISLTFQFTLSTLVLRSNASKFATLTYLNTLFSVTSMVMHRPSLTLWPFGKLSSETLLTVLRSLLTLWLLQVSLSGMLSRDLSFFSLTAMTARDQSTVLLALRDSCSWVMSTNHRVSVKREWTCRLSTQVPQLTISIF